MLAKTEETKEEDEEGRPDTLMKSEFDQKPRRSKYLDYLLKVARAGPRGYLSSGAALGNETKLECQLRRWEPADALLRSVTSTRVTLRHWYFVFYILGETEQALQNAGYLDRTASDLQTRSCAHLPAALACSLPHGFCFLRLTR